MFTGLVGGHFGKVVVKNLLKQFTSSDNLLSGTWAVTGTGNSVDQTAQDTLIIADNGTLRADLDFDYLKGEVFTISVDIENVDVEAVISIGVVDNFLIGSTVDIATEPTRTRYSVTIDTTGMLGATIGKVQIGIADYVRGSTLKISNVFVERVTGKTNQNPSSYVSNSSSKQLNGFMHQADSSIPSTTVAEGCPLADGTQDINTTNSGWCWGSNTTWDITGNLLNSGAAFNSIHSKQFSSADRYYDYQYTIGVVKLLSLPQICGVVVEAGQDAIGTHLGRVVATGVEQLFVGNSGITLGGTISGVSIVETDEDSNVDGVAFRSHANNLTVDPATKKIGGGNEINGTYDTNTIYDGVKTVTTSWIAEPLATAVNVVWARSVTPSVINIGWGNTIEEAKVMRKQVLAGGSMFIEVTGNYVAWSGSGAGTFELGQSVLV